MWGDRGLCFLIENQRGDPSTSLYFGNGLIVLGTALGRVVGFVFASSANVAEDQGDLTDTDKPMAATTAKDSKDDSSGPSSVEWMCHTSEPIKDVAVQITSLRSSSHHLQKSQVIPTWCSLFRLSQPKIAEEIAHGPQGEFILFAAFSDDSIKVLYADKENVHAVVGNSQCRTWNRVSPQIQSGFRLDRRITSNHKYALQGVHSPLALIVTSGVTVIVNQREETQLLCPFKLPDRDLIPVDFDAHNLRMMLFLHRPNDPPCVKVFALPTNSDEPLWGRVLQPVFQHDVLYALGVTQVKFWGRNRLVIVCNGKYGTVYSIDSNIDYGQPLFTISPKKGDIIVIDGGREDRLIAITANQELLIWSHTGDVLGVYDISPATFRLGFPHVACQDNESDLIAFTSDSGVYLFDSTAGCMRLRR